MDENPDDVTPATEQSEGVRRPERLRHVDQEGAREVQTDAMEQSNSDLNDHKPPDTGTMAKC